MIDQFWVASGVAVVVSVALFGGYWKLMDFARSAQKDYQEDIGTIEAKIRSSRLVPKIISLYADITRDRSSTPDVAEIISRQEYAEKIRAIAEVDNEINDVKVIYSDLQSASYALAHSLLYFGVISMIAIPFLYLYGYGIPLINQVAIGGGITLIYVTIMLFAFRVIPQLIKHDRARRAFSDKYDEIMLGS